ncbi:MAG: hypothetical protein ACLSFT_06920 [Ruminococcus callidus]
MRLSGHDLLFCTMQLRKQWKRCCNPAAVFARDRRCHADSTGDILHDNGIGKTHNSFCRRTP